MNAQLAFEAAESARYENELIEAECFAAFVAELSRIPSFVDEALGELHHGRQTYLDSLVARIAEGSALQPVIDMAIEAYALKQRKASPLETDEEIVSWWQAHQQRKEAAR